MCALRRGTSDYIFFDKRARWRATPTRRRHGRRRRRRRRVHPPATRLRAHPLYSARARCGGAAYVPFTPIGQIRLHAVPRWSEAAASTTKII